MYIYIYMYMYVAGPLKALFRVLSVCSGLIAATEDIVRGPQRSPEVQGAGLFKTQSYLADF